MVGIHTAVCTLCKIGEQQMLCGIGLQTAGHCNVSGPGWSDYHKRLSMNHSTWFHACNNFYRMLLCTLLHCVVLVASCLSMATVRKLDQQKRLKAASY
jgi:hypothetical protein